MSPVVYWHTRTVAEFRAQARAWVESWAYPYRMLVIGTKKPQSARHRPGQRSQPQTRDSIVDWVPETRDSRGNVRKRNVVDLRDMLPLDRSWDPAKVQTLKGMMGAGRKGRTLLAAKRPA